MIILNYLVVCFVFFADIVTTQNPEINDQFEAINKNGTEITEPVVPLTISTIKSNDTTIVQDKDANKVKINIPVQDVAQEIQEVQELNFIIKLYNNIVASVKKFFKSYKVAFVMKNIGTCIVNGVMEILTHYLPAPMLPFIASAAGMVIPFEPVVVLRERMPVTSYRRAFNKAVNSFMGTFNEYKVDDTDDPYMTRRFNRRFMNDGGTTKRDDVL